MIWEVWYLNSYGYTSSLSPRQRSEIERTDRSKLNPSTWTSDFQGVSPESWCFRRCSRGSTFASFCANPDQIGPVHSIHLKIQRSSEKSKQDTFQIVWHPSLSANLKKQLNFARCLRSHRFTLVTSQLINFDVRIDWFLSCRQEWLFTKINPLIPTNSVHEPDIVIWMRIQNADLL